MSAESGDVVVTHRPSPGRVDAVSARWIEQLRVDSPQREETVAALHAILLDNARRELVRRRTQLGSVRGPEFDDLAQQAADDALVKILARLDQYAGLSRFTTWAYKFVIFEISRLVSRHAWQREPPRVETGEPARPADVLDPARRAESREQLALLSTAVDRLPARQREVFVAVALNGVAIDVLALELGSNRNAIYKNLFDARRSLRASLAAAGHPVFPRDGRHD